MKLTNKDIWIANGALRKLVTMSFPVGVAFKLARMASRLSETIRALDEVRIGLVKKHGKTDERGQSTVPEGSPEWEKFIGEFNDLLEMDTELAIEKVKLPSDNGLAVEPQLLMALEKFVEV